MKAITSVNKTVSVPRFTFNRLWLAIASVLRWVNRGYDDYDIREWMGELTPVELAAEAREAKAVQDWNDAAAYAWSDIWDEEVG